MPAPNPPNSGDPETPVAVADRLPQQSVPAPEDLDVLAFVADERRYAVELHAVEEVFATGHITPVPLAPDCVRGATNLRGQLVVLVDLNVLAGETKLRPVLPGDSAVLVHAAHLRAGFLLSRVIDVLAVPMARYESNSAKEDRWIAGRFVGTGGSLELVDVQSALEEVQQRSALSASQLISEENP